MPELVRKEDLPAASALNGIEFNFARAVGPALAGFVIAFAGIGAAFLLADAYCFFGFQHQQEKELSAAAAAYQKSIQFGTADDKTCPYDPFANGIAIYTNDTHEYDKALDMVHQALKAGKLLSPDLIVRLKKESGRSN